MDPMAFFAGCFRHETEYGEPDPNCPDCFDAEIDYRRHLEEN